MALGWTRCKVFITPITQDTARVTIHCYTPKPILKLLKNPKHLKSITRDGYVRVRNKLAKAPSLGNNHILCLTRLALGSRAIVTAAIHLTII
ncbi:MAG: hypothetical protein OXC46_08455 [Thaumarchaeota archaeon]|nr:hypothetical protein [Nitrososphaerota archaeon]